MKTSSELMTLGELINGFVGKEVVIPLLQRNYKWDVDDTGNMYDENKKRASAEKLFNDIHNAFVGGKKEYTIGMVTFYDANGIIQIIDGQQRIITLSVLAKALGCYERFLHVSFERDTEAKERESFFFGDRCSECVDVQHMEAALKKFNELISDHECSREELFAWMLDNLKIICRYTENEPLQEFLNLNENKTEFSSTDYDRAYQLKYHAEKQSITPAKIIKEHNEIQKYLYTNEHIYDLIKVRYPETANRMDLIFSRIKGAMKELSGYYEKIDASSEDRDVRYVKCYKYLEHCHKVLRSISQELEERDASRLNVNIYNSVIMLYRMDPNFKFFDLIDIDDIDSMTFEQKLQKQFNLLAETYGMNPSKNAFMQSQLSENIESDMEVEAGIESSAYHETERYVAQDILALFGSKVEETEAIIELGKNYSELIKGGKKSFREVLSIPEIKQIIVPSIQRDYTFGSNEKKVRKLLLDISKVYISDCIGKDETYKKGTAARIVAYYLKKGRFWKEIKSLNYATKEKYTEKEDGTDLFEKAGVSVYEYGYDWRGNERKSKLDKALSVWGECTKIDDFSEVKDGTFFITEKKYEQSLNNEFLFSVILGCLEDGNFYLYDGQQRMVTLVYLCAYLINRTYGNVDEVTKLRYKEYIELLSKFKFQERKEANDLLNHLLDLNKPITKKVTEELAQYVIDHSTYSIVKLLRIFEEYENGYGKEIISFTVDYLMKKVIFEFAVVKEAPIADQLYMDLNSKNVPLTPYENYKAELVYILSQRFSKHFDKNWKYRLDNMFLNSWYRHICEEKFGWEKACAEKAEEYEIKTIHWCFKMVCMELGISIGNIDDPRKRLRWLEENYAETVVDIVGTILNERIFVTDAIYGPLLKLIMESYSGTSNFSFEEFKVWFELRCYSTFKEQEYKFRKNGNSVRVYNLEKDDALNKALYWNFLTMYYQRNNQDEEGLKESEIVKLLLQKYHTYWTEGYLQADLTEDLFQISANTYERTEDAQRESEISQYSDYYSEKYLTDKPEDINWLEYIYTVKLNEMLDVDRYDMVATWEEEEFRQEKVFEDQDKRVALEKMFGDYAMWSYVDAEVKAESMGEGIELNGPQELKKELIEKLSTQLMRKARMKKCLLNESLSIDITIKDYDNNKDIMNSVIQYILDKKPVEFMKKVKEKYYIQTTEKDIDIYGYAEDCKSWNRVESLQVMKIKIPVSQMSEEFKQKLGENGNTEQNRISYVWSSYKRGDMDETTFSEWLEREITPEQYDFALKVLEEEKEDFKNEFQRLKGYLLHD